MRKSWKVKTEERIRQEERKKILEQAKQAQEEEKLRQKEERRRRFKQREENLIKGAAYQVVCWLQMLFFLILFSGVHRES